ncbi:Uncharacterized protein TCM_032032 [Theobroma cacao]|uniref:Uncharacterized protein n=1 Tax=Theobroma cacao TaxID=3641 RepID=A0A061F7W9_THECC|nr:Uncharacterized protein TCM_032032 [Theobroma cacao]
MGLIPRGAQFDTYDKYSYIGNLGLCGLPLSKICDNDDGLEPPSAISDGDDDIKRAFNWRFATLIGYGSGLVIGFFMGCIVFTTEKPWWFIRMIERVQQKYGRRIYTTQLMLLALTSCSKCSQVGCVPIKDQYSQVDNFSRVGLILFAYR